MTKGKPVSALVGFVAAIATMSGVTMRANADDQIQTAGPVSENTYDHAVAPAGTHYVDISDDQYAQLLRSGGSYDPAIVRIASALDESNGYEQSNTLDDATRYQPALRNSSDYSSTIVVSFAHCPRCVEEHRTNAILVTFLDTGLHALIPAEVYAPIVNIQVLASLANARAIEEKLSKVDFAGVKIGQSLSEVFQTLRKAHYVQHVGKLLYADVTGYKFEPECWPEQVGVGGDQRPTDTIKVTVCHAGPRGSDPVQSSAMLFKRVDSNGNVYTIAIDFTPVTNRDRANLLQNARVYYVYGTVVMKDAVGDQFYKDLLTNKYGAEWSYQLLPDDFGQHKYNMPANSSDHGTRFFAETGNQYVPGIRVQFEDREYYARLRDSVLDHLVAAGTQRSAKTAKPTF